MPERDPNAIRREGGLTIRIGPAILLPTPFLPPPGRPEIGIVPPEVDDSPDVALLPPVVPGVNQPPSRIFIPDAPPATGPGIGAVLGRVGFGAAIGVIAVELLSEIARTIQESRFRRLEEEAEAEVRMTRGRIEIRERDLRVETLPAGGDAISPPPGREVGLSDQDRFPFPDPAEEPLGDDPLPDLRPPIPAIIVPLPEFEVRPEPAPAPLPEPISDPTVPAPTLPQTTPGPGPTTTPGRRTRPARRPFPSPSPAPRAPASPRTSPFSFPFPIAFPTPSADPRPLVGPGQPTPTPTDVPLPDLTVFETPGVPLQQPVRDQRCPPCDQESKEPRLQCFRKLVKEALFEEDDEVFNWVEIDCVSGKEIKKGDFLI